MSGISGIIRFDGAPVKPGLIRRMTSSMSHRGPDGIHHWSRGSVALGQCMLCTTPESLNETQPLVNEKESLALVMDGRVDNREMLRRELLTRGRILRNHSDAELVLRAYELWSHDCLTHIDGDFAVVIWDVQRQEAFCARDRMGNKPFNYFWDGRTFVFASELHAILLLPWVPRNLNKGVLAEHLAEEWYSRDETFWKGVLRLVAAHQMKVDAAGPRIEQFWTPDLSATLPYSKDEEYIEHYRELFSDTVKRLSRSHLPLAIEVSGGLDSSAIFVVAENLRQNQKLQSSTINGYTLDFHDDPDANELEYSRAVGLKSGKRVKEIQPSTMPLTWYRDWATRYKDFPGYPNGVMSLGLMRKARQDGSRVLLNGTGGDEWLGGSRIYYAEELAARRWRQLISCFKFDLNDAGLRKSLWWILRFGFAPLLPEPLKKFLRDTISNRVDEFDRRTWLMPTLRKALEEQREKHHFSSTEQMRLVGRTGQLSHLSDAYSILAHEGQERLSATAGLELRRPYWNPSMVQFSFLMPQRLLFRHGINKFAHRQAMRGLLPELVLKRQTKAEFSVTYHRHLPEMKDLLTRDIPTRRFSWINQRDASMLYSKIGQEGEYKGWSESMLWILFGCDTFIPNS